MHHQAILDTLRKTGYRLTPQRELVLAALAERSGHMDVKEVHESVTRAHPFIDLATVYRTLQLLVKLHLVTAIQEPNGTTYELLPQAKRHHHMVCEDCRSTFELPPRYLEAFRDQLLHEVGFEPHMEHFTISGLCTACRKQGRSG